MPPDPLVGTHAYMCMSVLSHAIIILLSPRSPPPPQLKILYETLCHVGVQGGSGSCGGLGEWSYFVLNQTAKQVTTVV